MLLHDYSVPLPLLVIVFMHFAHELEKTSSTTYNYYAIQTELEEPTLFGTIKADKHLVV